MSKIGYVGIGVYHPKTETNIGTLIRSAVCFEANFVFTIGRRYRPQASAVKTDRHIPVFNYQSYEDFLNAKPVKARIIYIDNYEGAKDLSTFCHPEQAIYMLGAEDHGTPRKIIGNNIVVSITTSHCLNVASAGTVILYDRQTKINSKKMK